MMLKWTYAMFLYANVGIDDQYIPSSNLYKGDGIQMEISIDTDCLTSQNVVLGGLSQLKPYCYHKQYYNV